VTFAFFWIPRARDANDFRFAKLDFNSKDCYVSAPWVVEGLASASCIGSVKLAQRGA